MRLGAFLFVENEDGVFIRCLGIASRFWDRWGCGVCLLWIWDSGVFWRFVGRCRWWGYRGYRICYHRCRGVGVALYHN